jgi:tRNA (adenine22-N1)-methyltransferase
LRLQALANYHSYHESIWDIGCDHGKLGLSFAENKAVKSIHLVDPSELVMSRLKQKLKDAYITEQVLINTYLCKGQEVKLDSLNKIIFIAGMGGKEIRDIVLQLIPQMKQEDTLVLSPHRGIHELRSFLFRSELGLFEELVVSEDSQFYQILCLKKSHLLPKTHPFGDLIWRGPIGEDYRQHVLKSLKDHQDVISQEYFSYLMNLSC